MDSMHFPTLLPLSNGLIQDWDWSNHSTFQLPGHYLEWCLLERSRTITIILWISRLWTPCSDHPNSNSLQYTSSLDLSSGLRQVPVRSPHVLSGYKCLYICSTGVTNCWKPVKHIVRQSIIENQMVWFYSHLCKYAIANMQCASLLKNFERS